MTTEERLQELLDQKDVEIRRLDAEVGVLRRDLDDNFRKLERAQLLLEHCVSTGWMIGNTLANDQTLPVPRLELTIVQDDQGDLTWYYRLIYRVYDGDVVSVPLGHTRSRSRGRGSPRQDDGHLELPFRDGVHIHHDMAHLGLPAFIVWKEHAEQLNGERLRDGGVEVIERGRRHRSGGL
jgi:hypothetical protein